ncbi:hypothetical protein CLV98_104114 [Dyadobacter jejuensis]|uniref:HTH araC/xylS-type domain-containing protein n=1 Tax=Dyadobacter jejuensis TaxID=1082580 RepID=A0A316AKV3_9BACT|nr:hypothetical protein [Dyadobacter jejuensis]PWJ58256.1 hypothetical protein CLV98_104114 [Dyadobacter jejuensis]
MALEERLALTDSITKKIQILQKFLIANLHFQNTDLIIDRSIEKIKAVNGFISIKELSSSLNMSLDAFE